MSTLPTPWQHNHLRTTPDFASARSWRRQWVRVQTALWLSVGVILSASPAYAEDIDVYFSQTGNESRANVVLMLDTSGSMAWCEGNFNCGDPQRIRMEQLKRAFRSLVGNLGGNVRMGLARLGPDSNGGYMIAEVRGLDEPAGDVAIDMPVATGRDDAQQVGLQAGDLTVTGNTVAIPNGGVAGGEAGLIFRNIAVPRHARVLKAVIQAESAASSGADLRMRSSYQVGQNLPDFLSAPIMSRSWIGDSPIDILAATPWSNRGAAPIDVTDLLESAMVDANWCGGFDVAIRLRSTNPTDTASRAIFAFESIVNNDPSGPQAARLQIEWEANTSLAVTSPADPNYESTLTCKTGIQQPILENRDDAHQQGSSVSTNTGALDLDGNGIGAFRFAQVPFDARPGLPAPDVVNQATLRFVGVDAEEQVCVRFRRNGSCRQFGWRDITSGTVDLLIEGIRGSAGTITTGSNNISSRNPVAATQVITVNAARNEFTRIHEVDVTAMVRQMMSDPGWRLDGALMFRVRALSAGNRNFEIGAREGGAATAAGLELAMSLSQMNRIVPLYRDELIEVVNGLTPNGGTPLAEAHTEVARYMMGAPTFFDAGRGDPNTKSGSRYDSPIDSPLDVCSSNNIVLMSDGVPNNDSSADNSLTSLANMTIFGVNDGGTIESCDDVDTGNPVSSFSCMVETARFTLDKNRNQVNRQVNTHLVGFHLDDFSLGQMERVSTVGGGTTFGANDAESLAEAFSTIINSVTRDAGSFAAPGVAVNQLNRLQHLDQLYYGIFKPDTRNRWEGNLKRYRLAFERNPPEIVDENGVAAVDNQTGFFKDESNSFWGELPNGTDPDDGNDVTVGGARQELEQALVNTERNLLAFTSTPSQGSSPTASSAPGGVAPILVTGANSVTNAQLGMVATADASEREERVAFLSNAWGDPLHSEPRLVNYGFSGSLEQALLDPDRQDNTVFVANNDGMLIAVDAKTGVEEFALLPAEELAKTEDRFVNDGMPNGDVSRSTYGLDGGITVWRRPRLDGSGDAEDVFLYVGQRRGGSRYYAFDVSNRAAPKLMWSIQGGSSGFERLGQTWSQPTLAQIKLNGNKVPVLIFGGGYSPADHDDPNNISAGDVTANAIYIVNAYNGAPIWSASSATGVTERHADMKWSIPGGVSAVDIDNDGVVDHLYAADLGGQVFRIDLDAENGGVNSLAKRIVTLAKLGTSEASGIDDHRRFFGAPVVALSVRDGQFLLQVVIGSGYREGPLETATDDRIFALDDTDALQAFGAMFSPSAPIENDDLLDVTNNLSPSPSDFNGRRGWFIDLDEPGEKVVSSAAVVDGRLFIASFLPESIAIDACSSTIGGSRLYGVNVLDGSPALENSGSFERSVDLNLAGLPPSPQVLLGPEGKLVTIVGTGASDGGELTEDGLRKARWYQVDNANEAQAVLDETTQAQQP